jgi:hypothetical protein
MSARRTNVPVLLGPVACIGCGPTAVPPGRSWLEDRSEFSYMLAGSGNMTAWSKEAQYRALSRKVETAAGKLCRGEVRVTSIDAGTYSVVTLVINRYHVEIDVKGVPLSMPPRMCASPMPDAVKLRDAGEEPK